MICGIYGLRHLTTDRWYIGQSRDIYYRWNKAYDRMHCKNQIKLWRALKRYGVESFEKRIIELCDLDIPQEVLDKKETSWITHFNSVENGYNLTYGGRCGKKSEETRRRISESNTGKRHSDETRRKMSAHIKTAEHRKKMSLARRGKTMSEETKRKISDSERGIKRAPFSVEHIENIRKARLGTSWTTEQRASFMASVERRRSSGLLVGRPKKQVVDTVSISVQTPTK